MAKSDSRTTVVVGTTFYVDIWTKDKGTPLQGISGGYLNIAYSTDKLDATALSHGANYTALPSRTISDLTGLITDFGGSALGVGTSGMNDWARLGSWNRSLSVVKCVKHVSQPRRDYHGKTQESNVSLSNHSTPCDGAA